MENQSVIKILPPYLVNQIKAGEIIERPSSLLKELIENSLDAKASQLSVHLVDSGIELIHIEDDGLGMNFSDLPLAFTKHATSKIKKYDDLFNVSSYGFRGEALAAMSSVSKVICTSFPQTTGVGGKISFEGGDLKYHQKNFEGTSGTSFFIRDLFYNTPVRLKFLKSKTSENRALRNVLDAFLLTWPSIDFRIKWDNKDVEYYPQVLSENIVQRINRVYLKIRDHECEILSMGGEYEGYHLQVYIIPKKNAGNANKRSYVFVNKRIIFDKIIHQRITYSLEKSLKKDRSTYNYLIFLEMPSEQLDVNVHPSKTEVKFESPEIIYSLINSLAKKITPSFSEFSIKNADDFNEKESSIIVKGNYSLEKNYLSVIQLFPQNFVLLKLEEDVYLLKTNRLLSYYFLKSINNIFPLPEEKIIPLLISDPFECKNVDFDNHFSYLTNIGLEFDRLNEKTLVLRTIPDYLEGLPYKDLIRAFLSYFLENNFSKEHTIDLLKGFLLYNWNFKLKEESCDLLIEKAHEFLDLKSLLSEQIIKKLDLDLLNKIYMNKHAMY